jgi:hypothetical protein
MRAKVTRRDLVKASLAAIPALSLAAEATNDRTAGFKLGIITDEITSDLEEALKFSSSFGLHYCELREFWGRTFMNWSQEDLDRAKKLLAQYNIQVSDIGSPIFKWDLPGVPGKNENERALSKVLTAKPIRTRCSNNPSKLHITLTAIRSASSVTGALRIRTKCSRG